MPATQLAADIIPVERIAARIYLIRRHKVMMDSDLAELYGVGTKNVNLAVRRNPRRFPEDFMFQLTEEEAEALRFQNETSKSATGNSAGKEARGGRRYLPYAFTEQGVAMLSSVLRGERAADVNVAIMRTFVRLREALATNEDLIRKVNKHDRQIAVLFDHVQQILAPAPANRKPIGFIPPRNNG